MRFRLVNLFREIVSVNRDRVGRDRGGTTPGFEVIEAGPWPSRPAGEKGGLLREFFTSFLPATADPRKIAVDCLAGHVERVHQPFHVYPVTGEEVRSNGVVSRSGDLRGNAPISGVGRIEPAGIEMNIHVETGGVEIGKLGNRLESERAFSNPGYKIDIRIGINEIFLTCRFDDADSIGKFFDSLTKVNFY